MLGLKLPRFVLGLLQMDLRTEDSYIEKSQNRFVTKITELFVRVLFCSVLVGICVATLKKT